MYDDSLITITNDRIILKCYYSPVGLSKCILFKNIADIQVYEPTLHNNKFRIWGSSDFKTWFPFDLRRSFRDTVFSINIKDSWFRSGFTAESPFRVIQTLSAKGLVFKKGA